MNSSIKVKHLVILVVIAGLGYLGYSMRSEIFAFTRSLTRSDAERTVDNALIYLKDQKGSKLEVFDIDFSLNLLSKYSFYKIDEWELQSKEESPSKYLVAVKGKTKMLLELS